MSTEIKEHVEIETTANTTGVTANGFGTIAIVSCNATFPERSRAYSNKAEVAEDGATFGYPGTKSVEYRQVAAAFAQRPRPKQVKIIRVDGKPTLQYRIDLLAATVGAKYALNLAGGIDAIADTECAYTALADLDFVDGDVTVGTDLITETAHGMTNGDGPYRLKNAGGALPAGLAADTNVWIHVPTGNADQYGFATSKADALAGTLIDITAAAGGGTHTLVRGQNDTIIAQLVDRVNAIASKNFTAAQVPGAGETDYMTITGDVAGVWFSVSNDKLALMKIECVHAEPATPIATAMNAVHEEDPDFYGVSYPYPSDACVKAMSAWCESAESPKLYIAGMSDTTIATAIDGGGDTASDLKALTRARTAVLYHHVPAQFAACAWMGRVLCTETGRATWKFKLLRGVVSSTLSTTQRNNIRAKNANAYRLTGPRNMTWEGTTADGDFIDIIRNIDWIDDRMSTRIIDAMQTNDIIPMTEKGKQIIVNEMDATLTEAVRRGILSDDEEDAPTIIAPLISEVDENDRAERLLPDLGYEGRLAGAIHKVKIRGNVRV